MNRFVKAAVLAMASAAVVVAPLSISAASAHGWYGGWGGPGPYWGGPRWGGPGPYWGGYRHHDHRDAWAAGAIGLAAGAILGGALSQPTYAAPYAPAPVIYQQPPVVYYPPVQTRTRVVTRYVTYQGNYQPWTRGWYSYCSSRYRSFNPRTGTFVGYDGQSHFCTAN
ncbi:BA14K family protein [Phyllobacterium leguminum]|uniref:Lectin-like protein BA14k n=1 Tax=Phyllobacterium leguminum TaxID=314237 RepID=A0A318T0W3_9HYPH|nr:BA14K family protein [Phyllobacterium leguminum]PYE87362.1 BA14K-like protein [Phyllobacterium leguminum]